MNVSALLRQTAARYEAAVQQVLAEWSPECGCQHPGVHPYCLHCPCVSTFENLVQQQINQLHLQEKGLVPQTDQTNEQTCIYFSKSQV
jgi:hypothetical protein